MRDRHIDPLAMGTDPEIDSPGDHDGEAISGEMVERMKSLPLPAVNDVMHTLKRTCGG